MNISFAVRRSTCFVVLTLVLLSVSCKRRNAAEFIKVNDPVIALTHVRVIDGTGGAAKDDQTIIIDSGRITAIGPTSTTSIPASAKSFDFGGHWLDQRFIFRVLI